MAEPAERPRRRRGRRRRSSSAALDERRAPRRRSREQPRRPCARRVGMRAAAGAGAGERRVADPRGDLERPGASRAVADVRLPADLAPQPDQRVLAVTLAKPRRARAGSLSIATSSSTPRSGCPGGPLGGLRAHLGAGRRTRWHQLPARCRRAATASARMQAQPPAAAERALGVADHAALARGGAAAPRARAREDRATASIEPQPGAQRSDGAAAVPSSGRRGRWRRRARPGARVARRV